MHPHMERELAVQRAEELRRVGAAAGRDGVAPLRQAPRDVVLRTARPDDEAALTTLAARDGARAPAGPALVAEVDGSIRAAIPLDGGRAFADPFRPSHDLIELLEARAGQLTHARAASGQHHRLAWLAPAALRRLV